LTEASLNRYVVIENQQPTTHDSVVSTDIQIGQSLEHLSENPKQVDRGTRIRSRDVIVPVFGSGRIAVLGERSRLPNLSATIAKLRLARRRLGSWQEVGRRFRKYIATEGLAMAFSRFRNYGTASINADAIIQNRSEAIRADIKRRITHPPPGSSGSDDIVDGPVISIILPVYRTPVSLLEKAIGSVLQQSYPRWELCIVDDCSKQATITDRLRRHAARDSRIKLRLSDSNAGIAAASNQAIAMATGDYVGFLDHDDVLTCDSLHCIASAIVNDPDSDVIYTDECKIDDTDGIHEIFCKPDWSPALMFNCMYIGHLAVYRRLLIEQVGGLRSQYDFSQDYDLALRVTEARIKVQHIDRVLYCWRMTQGSAAAGDKPYARQSNIAALQDALDRRDYPAEAVALPTANHARWRRSELRGKVSVIIPSDDAERIVESVRSIQENTSYADYEMIVVTQSAIARELTDLHDVRSLRFAHYDKPYNFSDKCNVGAAQADGEYLIFFNDDVRIITSDWIEALLECLQIEAVGAAAPKLLYENGTIQHAGLVSGVRRLIGTAFHCLPADTTTYFNFAQSLREVSSLSAACLMMPGILFRALSGFDIVNTPIGHSDVDLCFRLRDLGYRCLYTPHATLRHIGHQSLATYEQESLETATVTDRSTRRLKDKSDIHLLRQWPNLVAHDPYFPREMKGLLYADSPQDFEIHPSRPKLGGSGLDVLILLHDLSNSGAPRVAFDMARTLVEADHFVVVMAPEDGFFRDRLVAIGVTVIVEPLLLAQHESLLHFARNFDRVIINTVVAWPAVLQLSRAVEVYWYIHEAQWIADEFEHRGDYVQALLEAKEVWVVSKRAQCIIRKRRADVRIVETGVADPFEGCNFHGTIREPNSPVVVAIIGSYEPRKGQDLAIDGIKLLPAAIRSHCVFNFFGRILDRPFHSTISHRARGMPEVRLFAELSHDECLNAMRNADVILCPSRDDSFSLVAMEALALGKVLLCTRTTGASDYIRHRSSGFVILENTPRSISAAIVRCLRMRAAWPEIARNGREIFLGHFGQEAFSERIKRRLAA
jgi:GT2 family glycosyltransferase